MMELFELSPMEIYHTCLVVGGGLILLFAPLVYREWRRTAR